MLIFFQLLSWLRVESSFLVAVFHTVLLRMFAWKPYMYLRKNGQTQQQFFNSGCHACISCLFKMYIDWLLQIIQLAITCRSLPMSLLS